MLKRTVGLTTVYGLLLAVTLGGIIYHYLSGYDYPATPASTFEINVLGDLYEAFLLVPVGVLGLWAWRRERSWGALIIAGVAVNFAYNYAMFLTGRQNMWVFIWVLKLALSGAALCLVWRHLPPGPGRRTRPGLVISAYLSTVLLLFAGLMGRRLLASASGRAVDMTMQGAGALDWGEPFLRDPIIFFAFICPVIITAILGLWQGAEWGGRAASLSTAFIVSIVTAALFTGPLKEYLQVGTVSAAMWTISGIMVLAAAPAVWGLLWLSKWKAGVQVE